MMGVNIWAVLAAAVASMIVGSIWYGPLFGKMYTSLMGMDKLSQAERDAMKKGMIKMYLVQFIASIVMFFVLAWLISSLGYNDVAGALKVGLLAWLGFHVTLHLGNALWGGKMKMFWLSIGNGLITVVVGAAILGLWR